MDLWKQFIAVYAREFKLILHDQGIIVFLAFLPLAYPVVYSLIYNPEVVREVATVVVDHDRTAASRELVRDLDATQWIDVTGYATDLPDARKAHNEHRCYGILEIPQGFSKALGRGEQGKAVIYSDMSLMLRYRALLMGSSQVMMACGADIAQKDMSELAALSAQYAPEGILNITPVSMGNITSGFDSFIMPGVVVLILQQCFILAIGMAGGAKRERKTLIGYDSVNMQPSVLMTMLGQAACYMTIMMLPAIWLLHYVPLIFHFPQAGNLLEIFALVGPLALASCFMGFCVQGFIWEREQIFVVWVVTSVIFLFLSGLTWPFFAIHGFWKVLSVMVPATWGVEGFIRMNGNGASLAQVSECFWWLWGLVLFYGAAAYAVQRWLVRPTEVLQPVPASPN